MACVDLPEADVRMSAPPLSQPRRPGRFYDCNGSIGNIDKSIATVRFRDGRRRLTLLV